MRIISPWGVVDYPGVETILIHDQISPVTTLTVEHGRGRPVSVRLTERGSFPRAELLATVEDVDDNNTKVSFNSQVISRS